MQNTSHRNSPWTTSFSIPCNRTPHSSLNESTNSMNTQSLPISFIVFKPHSTNKASPRSRPLKNIALRKKKQNQLPNPVFSNISKYGVFCATCRQVLFFIPCFTRIAKFVNKALRSDQLFSNWRKYFWPYEDIHGCHPQKCHYICSYAAVPKRATQTESYIMWSSGLAQRERCDTTRKGWDKPAVLKGKKAGAASLNIFSTPRTHTFLIHTHALNSVKNRSES